MPADFAYPGNNQIALRLSCWWIAAKWITKPVQFHSLEVVVFQVFTDMAHHEGANFRMLIVQSCPAHLPTVFRVQGMAFEAVFFLLEQRAVEVASRGVGCAMHIVHAHGHPGTNASSAAGFGGFSQPIDARVYQVLVKIEELHLAIEIGIHLIGRCPYCDGVASEEFAIAAMVSVEYGLKLLAGIPSHLGVRIDEKRVDSAIGKQIDVAMNRSGRIRAALRLPEFGIVKIRTAIAVEQIAMAEGRNFLGLARCLRRRSNSGRMAQ